MRATYLYGAGDVRVIDVPDPAVQHPTDALVRVVASCICGSDLHPYHNRPPSDDGASIGHEFLGVVEDTGADVATIKRGDLVIAPFAWSDGTCDFCREGLQTSCRHGGFWNSGDVGGGQAEAVRVPLADGTLVAVPVEEDSPLLPSLLTLSDVYGTGYHAATKARVSPAHHRHRHRRRRRRTPGRARRQTPRRRTDHPHGPPHRPHRPRPRLRRHRRRRRTRRGRHRRRSATSPAATAPTPSSKPSATCPPTNRPSASSAPAASSAASASPNTTRHPSASAPCSARTSPSPAAPHPPAPTSAPCCPTSSSGAVDPGKVFDRTIGLEQTADGYKAMDERTALKVLIRD